MPQLLPYFWINQAIFTFTALFFLVYILSVYILPLILELTVIRTYITNI